MSEPNPQNWTPIGEAQLLALIDSAECEMDETVFAFWRRVRVKPAKWAHSPIGDLGGGFWVVAICGQHCFWFNDIEDGFNVSPWNEFEVIGDYRCNQSSLAETMRGYLQDVMADIQNPPVRNWNECR